MDNKEFKLPHLDEKKKKKLIEAMSHVRCDINFNFD